MITLGIETSGRAASLALLGAGDPRTVELDPTGRRHARDLVPAAVRLFADAGRTPADCALVAVGVGPGSFTGLRVGVVFAKTLAWSVGCPVVAVETPAACAWGRTDDGPVHVIVNAGRGEVFASEWHEADGVPVRAGEIRIVPFDDWLAERTPADRVTGPAADAHAEAIAFRCTPLPGPRHPTAAAVVSLGRRLLEHRGADDPVELEPLYVRRSYAEEARDISD